MQKRTRSRTPPISLERFAAEVRRGGPALDGLRAAQLAEEIRLESAMAHVDAREHARLRRKYGEEHSRTKEIAARAEERRAYQAELVIAHRNAATPAPERGKGWAVDGFVRTADGAPVRGVTVAPSDREGRWRREFGYACTDEQGYFRLIAEQLPPESTRVYLRAFDRERAVPSNEIRLAPRAGRVDRIAIVIDRAGKGDCGPPGGARADMRRSVPPAPPTPAPVARPAGKSAAHTPAAPEAAAKSAPRQRKAAKRKPRGKTRSRK